MVEFIIVTLVLVIFFIYLLIDLGSVGGSLNKFFDKWSVKFLWLWLPFYALVQLSKIIIFHKENKKKENIPL